MHNINKRLNLKFRYVPDWCPMCVGSCNGGVRVLVIINNEANLSLLLLMVAELTYIWFSDVVFAILFRRRWEDAQYIFTDTTPTQ